MCYFLFSHLKVGFFDESDHCIEYRDESLVEQESKTVWLERAESVRFELKMVDLL